MAEERLLTTSEVAATFRVSVNTVSRWARQGILHATKSPGGRDWRYREAEVLALAATRGGNSS